METVWRQDVVLDVENENLKSTHVLRYEYCSKPETKSIGTISMIRLEVLKGQ